MLSIHPPLIRAFMVIFVVRLPFLFTRCSMFILFCILFVLRSVSPVSMYSASLGVDLGTFSTLFMMLSRIWLCFLSSALVGSHVSAVFKAMDVISASMSFHIVLSSICLKLASPAIVRIFWVFHTRGAQV